MLPIWKVYFRILLGIEKDQQFVTACFFLLLGDRHCQRLQSVDEGLPYQRHALGHGVGPNQAFGAGNVTFSFLVNCSLYPQLLQII